MNIRYEKMDAWADQARAFFKDHWQSETTIVNSGEYHLADLNGIVAVTADDQVVGLVTYTVHGNAMEIVSLNSNQPQQGIGSKLMAAAEARAQATRLTQMVVTITNDNLDAMRFYQKRGYRFAKVIRGSVDTARTIKPTVPETGNDGIAIHDELLMNKNLPR
ncbi:GNAT family N-acetyltransferase [Lacticaseibacillus baoqingensis]|uniref:GNAT family N-acetyltransferase n=1 Tax=Lacticaseibacillus baoqingensis TaxID=2486013 RepID=A0ABW4E8T9_9LACO|nr:GNAT family N-acetyltransferase [Lacticaseibacillus baoqingensis]